MLAKYKDESEHVVTTDLNIIDNDGLRVPMEAGTTFVENTARLKTMMIMTMMALIMTLDQWRLNCWRLALSHISRRAVI